MLTKNLQYALNWSFQCQKIKKNERENLNITKELQKGITNYNRIFFKNRLHPDIPEQNYV